MIVQGLGLNSIIEQKARVARTQTRAGSESKAQPLFDTKDTYESADLAERAALLKSIKNKIKSGFYGTDSVLEDLSHGFAKALDQTL